jgi:uridine phosphorylase
VFPILEFDHNRDSFIDPAKTLKKKDVPELCVISYFRDIIERVAAEQKAKIVVPNQWEDGPHPLYEIDHKGHRLAFYHPGVGGALAAGLLEEFIAYGCRTFLVCGGCGVLDEIVLEKHIVCIDSAVRDEGTSYHYLPPAREVLANKTGLQEITAYLEETNTPFISGKTWTTDAPYRETRGKIETRKKEGCIVVDMEAASMMAVAEYRGVVLNQIMYGGDDLTKENWDSRNWQNKKDMREFLFWLCADILIRMEGRTG